MTSRWLKSPRALVLGPMALLIAIAVACGGTAEPVVIEKEVVKEVIKEVPVEKQVVVEKVVTAVPPAVAKIEQKND